MSLHMGKGKSDMIFLETSDDLCVRIHQYSKKEKLVILKTFFGAFWKHFQESAHYAVTSFPIRVQLQNKLNDFLT